MKITIEGLGERDTIGDENEILWFLKVKVSKMGKAARTNYLLAFKESNFEAIQNAFQIRHFLQFFISEKHELK